MSGNGKQVQSAPGQSQRYSCARPPTPQRGEGFHGAGPQGGSQGGYATASAPPPQPTMRGPPPQQSQQQAPQEMKPNHPYGRQAQAQAQVQQTYQYRGQQQQGTPPRQPSHHRQPTIYGTTPGAVYNSMPAVIYAPHMSIAPPPFSQQPTPRQPYYPQTGSIQPILQQQAYYSAYGTQQQPQYFLASGGAQTSAGMAMAGGAGRAAPTGQSQSLQQPTQQQPTHALAPNRYQQTAPPHQGAGQEKKRRPNAIAIVDPKSGRDVTQELLEGQTSEGADSERATPRPDECGQAVVQEFARRVADRANERDSSERSDSEPPSSGADSEFRSARPSPAADGRDSAPADERQEERPVERPIKIEASDTPVVSAISDSPEIVLKQCPVVVKSKQDTHLNQSRAEERKPSTKPAKQADRQPVEIVAPAPTPERAPSEPRRESVDPEPAPAPSQPPPPVEAAIELPVISAVEPEISIPSQDILLSSPVENVNGDRETPCKEAIEKAVEPPAPAAIETPEPDPPKIDKIDEKKSEPEVEKKPAPEPAGDSTPPDSSSHKSKQGSKKQQKSKNVPVAPPDRSPSPIPVREEAPKKKSHSPASSDALFLPAFEQKNKTRPTAKKPVEVVPESAAPPENKSKDVNDAMKKLKINDEINLTVDASPSSRPATENDSEAPKVNDTTKKIENSIDKSELDGENLNKLDGKEEPSEPKDSTDESAVDESGADKTEPDASGPLSLKYNYADDQWSPINTAGKKCYDPSFLMQLRDDPKSKQKPERIVSDNAFRQVRSSATDPSRAAGAVRQNDLLPGFARGSSGPHGVTPNRKSQHGKPNSKGGGAPGTGSGGRPNVIHVNLSLRSDVKLNETENAWKPTRMRATSLAEEEAATQDLYQTFRSILNKLTPEKFDTLMRKVKELSIDTEERLSGVIDLIFEKAIDEPNFSKAYALMCKELEQIKVLKEAPDGKGAVHVSFRILIVSRCQNEFEKEDNTSRRRQDEVDACTEPDRKKELALAMEEDERSARRRSVGNIRFIGELFKQGIIVSSVIMNCIRRLLLKTEEETLECLCKLLMTIGKDLENNNKITLQTYFNDMRSIVEGKAVSSRVRFMLQDVIELRHNSWVPRQQAANPQTMDRIKQDLEMESGKAANYSFAQSYSPAGGQGRKDDRPGNMAKRGGSKSVTDEGWSTAPARNSRAKPLAYVVDSGKLSKLGTLTPITQTSLQPSISSWGSGSNTNKKGDAWNSVHKTGAPVGATRAKPVNTTQVSNMYNVLDTFAPDGGTAVPEPTAPKKAGFQSKGASIERSTFKSDAADRTEHQKLDKDDIINRVNGVSLDSGAAGMAEKMKSSFTVEEMPIVIEEMVANGLECNDVTTMQQMGEAFGLLVVGRVITDDAFLQSFKQSMNASSNFFKMKGDIWKLLSGFLWAYIDRAPGVTFSQIHFAMAKVIELKKGYEFLSRFFIDKIKEGRDALQALWEGSDMELTDWMDEDGAEQFLDEFSLKFLTQKKGKAPPGPEAACEEMLKLMRDGGAEDAVDDWITRNVGEAASEVWFVRALTEAICTYTLCSGDHKPRFDDDSQKRYLRYSRILIRYVDNKHELQCLFAIQRLLNKLEHPQGIVCKLFEFLWDSGEVISSDGFLQWETSTDPHEQEGKGVMLKLLTSFFTLLKSEDSSDDTASGIEGEY